MKKVTSIIFSVLLTIMMITSLIPANVFAVDYLPDTAQPVTLNVYKYVAPDGTAASGLPNDGTAVTDSALDDKGYEPLENVTFKAYKVAEVGANYTSTAVPAGEPNATEVTNSSGLAEFTGLAQGIYLIVEDKSTLTDPSLITQTADPFLVSLPMTDETNLNKWLYTVNVYPKNYSILGAVILTKTFDGEAPKTGVTATFELYKKGTPDKKIGTTYTTDASGRIAVNNLTVGDYYFTETATTEGYILDSTHIEFSIVANGSVNAAYETDGVFVEDVAMDNQSNPGITKGVAKTEPGAPTSGINIASTKDAWWTITADIPDGIGDFESFYIVDDISTKLTLPAIAGFKVYGAKEGESDVLLTAGDDYTIAYDTTNTREVKIDFSDYLNVLSDYDSVIIKYSTKINLNSVENLEDILGDKIENQAILYYEKDPTPPGEDIPNIPTDKPTVETGGKRFVKVSSANESTTLNGAEFVIYPTEEDAKAGTNQIATQTSANGGKFEFVGLAYGEYWLVETKAPSGYQLNTTPISFTVSSTSYDNNAETPVLVTAEKVKNVPKIDLPITGGAGTIMFFTIGGILIIGAIVLLVASKKVSKKSK